MGKSHHNCERTIFTRNHQFATFYILRIPSMSEAKYRESLPQLTTARAFLTEGGIETTLVYEKQIDLPYFAAISLLNNHQGRQILSSCYQQYIDIALSKRAGIVLETRTLRGAKTWGEKLGIS